MYNVARYPFPWLNDTRVCVCARARVHAHRVTSLFIRQWEVNTLFFINSAVNVGVQTFL